MRRISWLIGSIAVVSILASSTLAQDVVNNASVIELKQAGLGDGVILNKIKSSKGDFDITTSGLKKLKEGGLSDEVINAIIASATSSVVPSRPKVLVAAISSDPNELHEPGIWLHQELGGEKRMVKLKPQSSGGSSGWNKKSRLVLYGSAAVLQLAGSYSFYYYEEPRQEGAFAPTPITADNFTLARMEVKTDKNTRRLAVGRQGFFGGKTSGLDPHAYIPVKTEKISEGVIQIVPIQPLQHGEYCFINKPDASREAFKGGVELFDFGVK